MSDATTRLNALRPRVDPRFVLTNAPPAPIFVDPLTGTQTRRKRADTTRLHLSVPHPMSETAGSWTWKPADQQWLP